MNERPLHEASTTSDAPIYSDLRFDDFVVESLGIRTDHHHSGADDASGTPTVQVTLDILRSGIDPRFLIPMIVKVNRRKEDLARFGYSLEVKALGYFSFDTGTDEHHIGHLMTLNAPAMLYGAIRGVALQALALTAVGRVVLPSVNFVQIMRQRQARLERKHKSSKTPT